MAPHSSVLAWRTPGTGEPGGLPSMVSHRVGHDWSDLAVAVKIEKKKIAWAWNTKLLAIFYSSLNSQRMIHNVTSFTGKTGAYKLFDKTIAPRSLLIKIIYRTSVSESHMGRGVSHLTFIPMILTQMFLESHFKNIITNQNTKAQSPESYKHMTNQWTKNF